MTGIVRKTIGAVVGVSASVYGYRRFSASESSDLVERTDKVAQSRKPRENALLRLQNVTIEAHESFGLRYYDPLRGVSIKSSSGPQPVFEEDDQGFHFLGTTDVLPGNACRGNYTTSRSSIIMRTRGEIPSDKYVLVKPLIVGKDYDCKGQALQETLLKDAIALAMQGLLDPVYNAPIYQCREETDISYVRCAKVAELTRMGDEVKAKIQEGQWTACHFRSVEEPLARRSKYEGTDAILLDLPSSHTCEDFLSGKLSCRDNEECL